MLGAILGAAGTVASSLLGKSAADRQAAMQMKFAKNAIQWKTADAVKAGLHPLAALGANTMSYSPVSVGVPDLGAMGQDVGRAITATQNGSERSADQVSRQLAPLQLERAGLENDLLRTQIASENAKLRGQIGPPMPTDGNPSLVIDGQGNTRRPPVKAFGLTINPKSSESSAQEGENEYGEPWDLVSAARLMRDADPVVSEFLRDEAKKAMRGDQIFCSP